MRRTFLLATMLTTGAGIVSSACIEGERVLAERTLTSTVALSGERVLLMNVPLPILIEGERRIADLVIDVDLTVTASSASKAESLADLVKIESKSEQGVLILGITEPPNAALGGRIHVRAPADMHVDVTERGGTCDVIAMQGAIRINSRAHTRVVGAEDDLFVAVEGGNALIDTDLAPGKSTTIQSGAGDIELAVPPGISANIEAVAPSIVITHPMLPRWPGGTNPYRANVSGGLNVVRLSTGNGVILIRSR